MHEHAIPQARAIRSERGFSLIEVVIAMFILAIVVSAGAFATVSGDAVSGAERAASQKALIARKALERVEGDLTARDTCNRGWRAQDSAGVYRPCNVPRFTMTDSDNRRYNVNVQVRPIDRPEDGTGRGRENSDADMNTRDQYDTTVSVTIDPASRAGLADRDATTPYELQGRVDWMQAKGLGSVQISVCVLDRPDRSTGTGRCTGTATAGANPAGGVRVTLTPQAGSSADARTVSATSVASNGGVASFTGVAPGSYMVTADASTFPANSKLHRITPKLLTVSGTATQEGSVILTYPGARVMVCARIINPDIGWGYEFTGVNIAYHQVGGSVVRTVDPQIRNMRYMTYRCATKVMSDPLGYHTGVLFRGHYGIEAEEIVPSRSPRRGLFVAGWKLDGGCGPGRAGSSTLGSSRLAAPGGRTFNRESQALFRLRDDNVHTICVDMWSQPIYDQRCEQLYWTERHTGSYMYNGKRYYYTYYHRHPYSPPRYPSGCREFPPQCIRYCPAGETVCVANCDGTPDAVVPGTAKAWNKSDDTQFAYGPNDGSVPCRTPRGQLRNAPYSSGSVRGWPYSQHVPRSTWNSYDWIGTPYGSGRHATGEISVCTGIGFAFSVNRVGPGKEFQFGDCIEMSHNGRTVRGRVWDYGPLIGSRIQPSIAAWSHIYPGDPKIAQDYYGANIPGHNGGRWPNVRYRHILGDPVCQSANGEVVGPGGGPIYEYRPPVMKPAEWRRAVDLPPPYMTAPPRPDRELVRSGTRSL